MILTTLLSMRKKYRSVVNHIVPQARQLLTFPDEVYKNKEARASMKLALEGLNRIYDEMRANHEVIETITYYRQIYGRWLIVRRPLFALQILMFPFGEYQKEQERDARTIENIRTRLEARLS